MALVCDTVQATAKACSVGCARRHRAKGLCNTHYKKQRQGAGRGVCQIAFCVRTLERRSDGLCNAHAQRKLRGADLLAPLKSFSNKSRTCNVPGCGNLVIASELCGKHYQRKVAGKPFRTPKDELGRGRRVDAADYIVITVPADAPSARITPKTNHYHMLEHRYVMQQYLRRTLLKTEQPHHRNETKTDNRIENLELKTGPRGKGIGARDDALHCLNRFEHLVALDLHQRAVLGEIRQMVADGNVHQLRPIKKGKAA